MTATLSAPALTVTPYSFDRLVVPDPVFDWRLETSRTALLVHDVQRYFLRPYEETGLLPDLVRGISAAIGFARENDVPVFYTAQPGGMTPRERGLLFDVWGSGMSREESDRGIWPELSPAPDDVVLTKWRYSAFHRSDLAERLALLDRDQLLVCGVYARVGIQATAVDSFSRDVQTFLLADATADFSLAGHQDALDYASANCARVLRCADLRSVRR